MQQAYVSMYCYRDEACRACCQAPTLASFRASVGALTDLEGWAGQQCSRATPLSVWCLGFVHIKLTSMSCLWTLSNTHDPDVLCRRVRYCGAPPQNLRGEVGDDAKLLLLWTRYMEGARDKTKTIANSAQPAQNIHSRLVVRSSNTLSS